MSRSFLYMPIQRWKPAERNALSSLTAALRPLVAPLIEIGVNGVSKTATPACLSNHLSAVAEQIAESCDGYEMFLDLLHLETLRPGLNCRNDQHPLAFTIDRLNAERFLFDDMRPTVVPVTGLHRSRRYQSAVANIAKGSRVCVRLTRRDLKMTNLNATLNKLLDSLRLEADHADLVVDLGIVGVTEIQAVGTQIERALPRPDIWNSLTVLAGSFPKDLSGFTSIGRHDVKRVEWDLYINRILKSRLLREFASFGDYTIQHAVYSEPPDFCRPSSSIRYADKDKWIVMRGEVPREGGAGREQWPANAMVLVDEPEFHGAPYSSGCKYIAEAATDLTKVGSSSSWLEAGINQHLTVTVKELWNVELTPIRSLWAPETRTFLRNSLRRPPLFRRNPLSGDEQ